MMLNTLVTRHKYYRNLLLPTILFNVFSTFSNSIPVTAISASRPMSTTNTNTGRVAIVTGANKGIGYHISLQLASSGLFSNVIIACRNERRATIALQRLENELKTSSPTNECKISYLPLTIGDISSHESFVRSVESVHERVDVLVNNGAIAYKGSDPTPFVKQCKPTLDVNYRGTVDLTERMLPLVRKGRDARIVNVASRAGSLNQIKSSELRDRFTDPELKKEELNSLVDRFQKDVEDGTHLENGWGNSNYGFSKLALIAMTRVWAGEEGSSGVRVNCFCPGYCDTDMTSNRGPRSASEGARTGTLLATMEDCPSGEFYADMRKAKWAPNVMNNTVSFLRQFGSMFKK